MNEHSPMFEELKYRWKLGYVTETQLRKRVELYERKPDKGISAEEFEEITGEPYDEQ